MKDQQQRDTDKIGEEYGGIDQRSAARNERLFNYLLITAVVVVIGAIAYQFVVYGPGSKYAERDRQARLQRRAEQEAAKLATLEQTERAEYGAAIARADSLLAQRAYEAAAFQLRNAIAIYPDSLTTRVALLEVYAANCRGQERQCASARSLHERLSVRPDVQRDSQLARRVAAAAVSQ